MRSCFNSLMKLYLNFKTLHILSYSAVFHRTTAKWKLPMSFFKISLRTLRQENCENFAIYFGENFLWFAQCVTQKAVKTG